MRRSPFRAPATVPAADRLEPLGTADLTMLASDCGPAPMHLAAVLLVDGADDGTSAVPDAFVTRAARVPRLTQVLVGPHRRPAWWHDPGADPAAHLTTRRLPGGGEQAVLDDAASLVCTSLDPGRPLWAARWLTGWDASPARRGALVVVLHHVLVDGVGGLGVLAELADPDDAADQPVRPAAPGSPAGTPHGPRAWLHGLLELGLGATLPVPAARTSLNRPTGPRRRIRTVRVPLAEFHDGAHRHGGSVNDAMVAAVVGALTQLLAARGEHPRRLVVSVPVTSRPAGDRRAGNDNGVIPVGVPAPLDREPRVRHVAAATARRKARPRGRSALPLSAAFRALAAAGLFRAFIEHQRMVHTFETNIRGPVKRLHVAGHPVSAVVPVAVSPGNVAVSFAVLSYAGELTVTAVTDPDLVPDDEALVAFLAAELDAFVQVTAQIRA
ncbi:MAG TPA: wax ester/triacylglycerol synthase domain-containing protein [Cellulomonas sp.]